MTNKYLYITLLAILGFNGEAQALGNLFAAADGEDTHSAPRLVVGITIDRLRSDFLEAYAPLYTERGFRLLMQEGRVYSNVAYPFTPVDRASAIAAVTTGTTPYYNNIGGVQWLNRETLRPIGCVDDPRYPGLLTTDNGSPAHIATSTLGDELKLATDGKAIVYAIAPWRDAAVLSAGHAADLALWIDYAQGSWCTSQYYTQTAPQWVRTFNRQHGTIRQHERTNLEVTELAEQCVAGTFIGRDDVTDLLWLTYDAGVELTNSQQTTEETYVQLDISISQLINYVEQKLGRDNVVFFVTGTGSRESASKTAYETYRIPTGTFYMNRAANLLNMYLGALWGSDNYVEATYRQQIFLNRKLLDTKKADWSQVLTQCQEIVAMMDGVSNVYTSLQLLTSQSPEFQKMRMGIAPRHCGDLMIEVAPGWSIMNEDTQENIAPSASQAPFPLIVYGNGTQAERITTPITTDRIAPTICSAIHIRAPNASTAAPLF